MKKENWKKELIKYLEQCHRKEFSYGLIDCCTFTADAVKAMTGVDFMAEFRGQYKTKKEALSAVKNIGSGTLLKTMKDKFGPFVNRGKFGDIAFMWGKDGPKLGICLGAESVFIGEDNGGALVKVASSEARFFEVK